MEKTTVEKYHTQLAMRYLEILLTDPLQSSGERSKGERSKMQEQEQTQTKQTLLTFLEVIQPQLVVVA